MSGAEFRVLYVLGMYHSGTTLLGNLAGQLDGYCSVGELRSIWRKLTLPHARCGCGDQLAACPVWRRVFRIAFGAREDPAELAREMWQYQQQAVSEYHTWRQVPSLLRRRGHDLPKSGPLARYTEGLARLYQAIAEETGAAVIVDSSKEPTDAALLLLMPAVDSTFVHLVRDPRGVVYSILRVQAGDRPVTESRWRQSAYTAFSWSAGNLAGTAVRRAAGQARSTLLRYEDFVASPHETVEALAQGYGTPARFDPSLDRGTVTIGPTHTVGGNNNRFHTGPVLVREDTAWRSQSHRLDKAVVTTVCAPLMVRYGYRLAPGRALTEPGSVIATDSEEHRHA
jgi:sulfotransferase family protein